MTRSSLLSDWRVMVLGIIYSVVVFLLVRFFGDIGLLLAVLTGFSLHYLLTSSAGFERDDSLVVLIASFVSALLALYLHHFILLFIFVPVFLYVFDRLI